MEPTTTRTACPECATPAGSGRFCGHCGHLLAPPASGSPAPPEETPAPVDGDTPGTGADAPLRHLGRARRWLFAGTGLALVALLGWLLAPNDADEVVTAPGNGSNSGVTSDVAPTQLDTVLWIREWPAEDGPVGIWPLDLDEDRLIVQADSTLAIDRDTGAVLVTPPMVSGQGPAATSARSDLFAERDRILEMAPDGTLRDLQPLGATVLRPVPLVGLPDGGWLVHDGRTTTVLDDDLTLRWTHGVSGDRRSEVVDTTGDTLLVEGDPGLHARDLATGEIRWRRDHRGGGADAVLVAGDLVLTGERGRAVAIDRTTGTTVWEGAGGLDLPQRWLVAADGVALGIRDAAGDVIAIDLRTGEALERRQVPFEDPWSVRAVADGLIGPVAGRPGVAVVDVDGAVRWERSDVAGTHVVVDPRLDREVLLAATGGAVEVIDPADGTTLERYEIPPRPRTTGFGPVGLGLRDRHLLVAGPGRSGVLVLDLATGEPIPGFDQTSSSNGWPVQALPAGLVIGTGNAEPRLVDGRGERRFGDLDHEVGRPIAQTPDGLVTEVVVEGTHGLAQVDPVTGELVGELLEGQPFEGWSAVATGDTVVAPAWGRGGPFTQELVALRTTPDGLIRAWTTERTADGRFLADGIHLLDVAMAVVEVRSIGDGIVANAYVLPHLAGGVALFDGTLVVSSPGGDLTVVDAASGRVRWTMELAARPTASPVIAGDVVHVGLEDGTVARIRLDGETLPPVEAGVGPVMATLPARGILVVQGADGVTALGPARLPDELATPLQLPPAEVDVPLP